MRTITFLSIASLLTGCGGSTSPTPITNNSVTLSVENGGYLAYKTDGGDWQQVYYKTTIDTASSGGTLSIAESCLNTYPIEVSITDLPTTYLANAIQDGRASDLIEPCDKQQSLTYTQTDTSFQVYDATIQGQIGTPDFPGDSVILLTQQYREPVATAFVAGKEEQPYFYCEKDIEFSNGDQRPLNFDSAFPGTSFPEPAHTADSYSALTYNLDTHEALSAPRTRQGSHWNFSSAPQCNNVLQQTWRYPVSGLSHGVYLVHYDSAPIENASAPTRVSQTSHQQTFRFDNTRIQSHIPELTFEGVPDNTFGYNLQLTTSSSAGNILIDYTSMVGAQRVSLSITLPTLASLPGLDGFLSTDVTVTSADLAAWWGVFSASSTSSYAYSDVYVSVTTQ